MKKRYKTIQWTGARLKADAKYSDKIAQITPTILRKSHRRDNMMQE